LRNKVDITSCIPINQKFKKEKGFIK